jgi:DNA-binding response OmpR family regulator
MSSPSSNPSQKRITLIDDDPAALGLIQKILKDGGYQSQIFDSADTAYEQIKKKGTDLIIVDAMMPGLNGYAFTKTLRKDPEFADIPILMLSRLRNKDDIKKALIAGVNDYVIKPVDPHIFLKKVELSLLKSSRRGLTIEFTHRDPNAQGALIHPIRIESLSETDIVISTQLKPDPQQTPQLELPLFHRIGVRLPEFRFLASESIDLSGTYPSTKYLVRYAILGWSEDDRDKFRKWIRNQVT